MNISERLSAKTKFKIMLAVIVVYAIITWACIRILIADNHEAENRLKTETSLKDNLAEIRNVQNDLFNLYSGNADKEKEDALMLQINNLCEQTEKITELLTGDENMDSRSMQQSAGVLVEEFDSYRKKIDEIISTEKQIRELGEEGGRLWENRKNVKNTLFQFTLEGINKLFDEAGKHESSFLASGEIDEYKNFNKKVDAIIAKLKSVNTGNILIKYQISKVSDQLTEYKTTFNLVFSKRLLLGLDTYDGYKGEAATLIKNMQTDLHEMMLESERLNNEHKKYLIAELAVCEIAATFVVILIFIFFAKSIIEPETRLKAYVSELLKGKLIKPNSPADSDNEIFNTMNMLGSLTQHNKEKLEFIEDVVNGKSDKGFILFSQDDEIGNSLNMLKESMAEQHRMQAERRHQEEIQDKINTALAEFGGILRKSNNDIEVLCNEIARNLIKYMGADYVAVYTYRDDDPDDIYLEMRSSYAADLQKFIKKRINLYEGLVGTCAVEKQMFVIDDIPENYIKIGSGFGFAKPAQLLIVPLLLNGNIFGMLELCRTEKFEEYRIKFIERLAEDIAITISYVNENTKNIFKLAESGKRIHDFSQQLQQVNKTAELQRKQIKEKNAEIERLQQENSKLKDFKMAAEKAR